MIAFISFHYKILNHLPRVISLLYILHVITCDKKGTQFTIEQQMVCENEIITGAKVHSLIVCCLYVLLGLNCTDTVKII